MSATNAVTAQKTDPKVDYVELAHKLDTSNRSNINKNPIFQFIIDGNGGREERMQQALKFFTEGLDAPVANVDDIMAREKEIDRRKEVATEFNVFVQAVRRQEAERQAMLLKDDASIDFQNALQSSTQGLSEISDAMARPIALAGYLEKFGASGNIVEQMQKAAKQVADRVARLSQWQARHTRALAMAQSAIADLDEKIQATHAKRDASASGPLTRFFGGATRLALDAELTNLISDREAKQAELDALRAEVPEPALQASTEIDAPADEEILKLQDISGPEFTQTVLHIRDLIIHNLAEISFKLDAAIVAMRKSQDAYQEMDRNATDADFSLSVLRTAVQAAERKTREITLGLKSEQAPINEGEQTAEQAMASLERMEQERYAREMQSYTTYLKDFAANLNLVTTSIRQGQASLQNKLRILNLHIQSATTHKVTALANSSEAATIMILSIVDMCNQAATRAFIDQSNAIRNVVDRGSKLAAQSITDAQQIHNDQVRDFIVSTQEIVKTLRSVSERSAALQREHAALDAELGKESDTLRDTTQQAATVHFDATAGMPTAIDKPVEAPPPEALGPFGLRNRRT